eukprot:CAMPEP_0201538148 /NCGR_PEP_ID=MMETSP0161_2-20130828/66829_1 /ASSEMBLY_ACC=CAM_ASM_000251 /TAXON_ID=180227 /ORGANISM="Neoparamoeba aestuarina, Strain SoJaBio B1-5/56/2" /LENGTH=195 /DNA_ID=CAMNT_0047944847 /DNA_START=202 /DNA_END=786 /DNA_ORIENTATION=-
MAKRNNRGTKMSLDDFRHSVGGESPSLSDLPSAPSRAPRGEGGAEKHSRTKSGKERNDQQQHNHSESSSKSKKQQPQSKTTNQKVNWNDFGANGYSAHPPSSSPPSSSPAISSWEGADSNTADCWEEFESEDPPPPTSVPTSSGTSSRNGGTTNGKNSSQKGYVAAASEHQLRPGGGLLTREGPTYSSKTKERKR